MGSSARKQDNPMIGVDMNIVIYLCILCIYYAHYWTVILSFGFDIITVRLMLGRELEVLMNRSKEHFTTMFISHKFEPNASRVSSRT